MIFTNFRPRENKIKKGIALYRITWVMRTSAMSCSNSSLPANAITNTKEATVQT